MKKKIISAIFAAVMVFNLAFTAVLAKTNAFELVSTQESENLGGTIYRYRHKKTGADVIYNDNKSDRREFALGFKTPPVDSKGANHVLEHALFCGSEKYPTKNIMHYIQNGTSSLYLNGVTADDCTYYMVMTKNQTEYYNMIDVYMNGIFHPLFLTDENIFRQQGIRIEYADGKAQYNGVVYNELRIKNLNTEENSVNFLADKLYRAIYGDTTPSYSAGGELDEIKKLTYEDLLRVYNTFYIPSNSMTYLAGNQDIDKTLDVLDEFFSENTKAAPKLSFRDTKQIPKEKIQEYNITWDTKTVDIGFMSSGVSADADPKDRYAVEIIYDIIRQKMEDKGCSNMYTVGGNTGGITALGMMVSRVPIADKDKIISYYDEVLDDLSANGIDDKDIDKYVDNDDRYFYQNFDRVMLGLLYKNDPLAYTEINAMREYYREHKEYFDELLKEYYTENPCSVTVVSGNGVFGTEDSSVNVSDEELEKIKRDTEEFQKWNDEEDDPDVIAKIPFLTLDEVKDAPEKTDPKLEEENGIKFYFTEKNADDETSASMYFPLTESNVDYAHLMYEFWKYQSDKADGGFFPSIAPFENTKNPNEINPHYNLWISGEDKAESLKNAVSLLKSEEMWNADDLKEYITSKPKEILGSYFDPYYLSGELKDSALSAEGRFFTYIPGNTLVGGSPHYYHFLLSLDTNDAREIISRLKAIADKMANTKPVVEYIGDRASYNEFKKTVTDLFKDAKEQKSVDLKLPIGCYSAATITKLADANHFMITAPIKTYSGKMAVLGNVLTTKYIYPTMRGKYGAYGCNIRFNEGSMTSAVTGLADIDFAVELWQGMGDYLRSMNMTQEELNSFIVSAVQEYDEWEYMSSENGANVALKNKSADECEKIRNEMLETTVDDIKGYADFIDELVNQKRVFAVLGKSAADSAKFDFAYYGNGDTLEVTPRLTKNRAEYIKGREDGSPDLDSNITRAEAAEIVSRIIADKREQSGTIEFKDVPRDAWYHDSVISLCEKEILSGYDDNTFRPNQNITRAEMAALLSKFIYDGNSEINASDVPESAWYAPYVAKMVNAGYISGYDNGMIRPDRYITRGEVKSIIDRMLNG